MSRNVSPSLTSSSDFGPRHAHARAQPAVELEHDRPVEHVLAARHRSSSASGSVVDRLDLGLRRSARCRPARRRSYRSRERGDRRLGDALGAHLLDALLAVAAPSRALTRARIPPRSDLPPPARSRLTTPGSRVRYARCSSVSTSISTPSEASLSRATSRSIASGTGVHAAGELAGRRARGTRRTAPAARSDTSMTSAGWPSAAARFTTRPRASRFRRRSPRSYCSTSGSTSRTLHGERAQRGEVDLDVEVAGVGEHRAVLHALEVLGGAARRGRR